MKKIHTLLIVSCLLVFISCETAPSPDASVVFKDVHVLSMEDDEIESGQTVMVYEGEVTWVGPSGEPRIPDDAEVIEGDYYIMPGLAEMHAHIPSTQQNGDYITDVLKLYLTQGITTIRGMLGEENHLSLRQQAAAGEIISPRIFTSGPSFSGNSVEDADQARQMVRDQVDAGYDLLKFHPGLELEHFEAIVDEARQHGMEFSGHISLDVGLERSLEAGKGTIDHLDRYMEFLAGDAADREDPPIIFFGYDLTYEVEETLIDEAARITAEAGTWNVPTNTLLENIFDPGYDIEEMKNRPGMEYMPDNHAEGWGNFVENLRTSDEYDPEQGLRYLELRNQLTLALHEQGAGLLLGADAPQIFNPPGFSAHKELESLVNAGLTPFEALRTATVNVGEYLGEENTVGKVSSGFRADLVVLDANPLESIPFHDHIVGVMSDGRYYDRAELDDILTDIRNREY